ncbi:MAG: aldo/keto reductase [Coriobacteriales bacterium]|jgi:predicted aldo/keto reductase-like oxidoreductase
MIYNDLLGKRVSMMGMGLMRLPVLDDTSSKIDEKTAKQMVDYAYEHGVNYFDTAWGYHGGNSETFIGKALKDYPRDSFNLVSKFPSYDASNFGKHEQIFEKQLEKCQVDYFDFYLLHNICETNIEKYMDEEKYGTVAYFLKQKELGRIKHLGFSVHGNFDIFSRFMERFGDVIEFCQIELNWFDWSFQDAKAKVDYCNEHNIPIIVMEPLRGGYLVDLDDEYRAELAAVNPDHSSVEWAFRWLQGIEGVTVVLSGSSAPEQIEQNIALFEERKPLTDPEKQALAKIAEKMSHEKGLPCTGCRYCISHCPVGLDIPYLISLYNEHQTKEASESFIAPMAVAALPADKRPSACIACNSCHDVCPQELPIPEYLAEFAAAVE